MNEEDAVLEELECAKSREDRYRWVIYLLLAVIGFFGGMTFQTERLRDQVVTNTATIRTIEKGFDSINLKLDKVLEVR